MSIPDPRLWCNCGEIGEVRADEFDGISGYRVFCKRNGAPCCMSQRGDTPDEAMDHFAKTQDEHAGRARMTLERFRGIVLRLSNQMFVRHSLWLNYPREPQIMGIHLGEEASEFLARELRDIRASKRSGRAKEYRRGKYRRLAYDTKQFSLQELCKVLATHGQSLGIQYGWKEDTAVVFGNESSHVLYVSIPQGQVSFHSPTRGIGPDYTGEWDGVKGASEDRIIQFCDSVEANR